MREIFVDKNVVFLSINKPEGDPTLDGKIKDVDFYFYKDEFFIKLKFETKVKVYLRKNDWHLVNNGVAIIVYDYDADTKPLHKEVELRKEAERYNI